MADMVEMHCASCGKVLAYIKSGSRIANGVSMYCAPCNPSNHIKPSYEIPDFLRGLMGKDRKYG
jgi:phage FluMu protein Com